MPSSVLIRTLEAHPHLVGIITSSPDSSGNIIHKIQGTWRYELAKSPAQEFQLTQKVSPMGQSPFDGVYQGTFNIEHQSDKHRSRSESVQENHVEISFTERGQEYKVVGGGSNNYGDFKLLGSAERVDDSRYKIDMYKIYDFMEDYTKFHEIKREHFEEEEESHQDTDTNIDDEREMTRVDGKGLWRSWKRNFNSQRTAMLDLVDNSLDASISGQNTGFLGHCHINTDTYTKMSKTSVTGITIINNCISQLPDLKQCLEVYDSTKVNSGADHVGENGVGLKQACATLSDRSFVLVKNGSSSRCELGIIAADLQSTKGVYLPAFQFSNDRNMSLTLAEQMKLVFSQPTRADVARVIAQYGAAFEESKPCLDIGIDRLCKIFDQICYHNKAFADSPHVFAVVVDKVRSANVDAITSIRVNTLLNELSSTISRTYLHVPITFDFRILGEPIEFTYWQARLVELSEFSIDVGSTVEWRKWKSQEDPAPLTFRVFCGFDSQDVMERDAPKVGALYVYSRQSGRLITFHKDARTMLALSAGGTEFCSGLRILLDDFEGHLPLNPTKQDLAFSEKTNGEIFRDNLWACVGSVAHLFYNHHIGKYGKRKTQLTDKVKSLAEQMAHEQGKTTHQRHDERKLVGEIANLQLTTFSLHPFKVSKTHLRVEGEEVAGRDTLYRLPNNNNAKKSSQSKRGGAKRKAEAEDSSTEKSSPSKRGGAKKKAETDEEWRSSRHQPRRQKKQKPQQQHHQSDSSDSELEVVCVIPPPRANTRSQSLQVKAEEDVNSIGDLFSSDDEEVASFLPRIPLTNAKPNLNQDKSADVAIKNEAAELQHDTEDEQDGETSLTKELAEKDRLVNAITAQLEQRNKTISELTRALQEKDREIANLKEQLLMICGEGTTSSSYL